MEAKNIYFDKFSLPANYSFDDLIKELNFFTNFSFLENWKKNLFMWIISSLIALQTIIKYFKSFYRSRPGILDNVDQSVFR